MATLSKHGEELVRLEYCECRIAYMADGKVLRNGGAGWKLYKKVKAGVNIKEHAQDVARKYQARREACPQWAGYVDMLVDLCSLEQRWKVHNAVAMMPGDADGVWSTLDDEHDCNGQFDLDELAKLCRLYEGGQAELKAYKAAHTEAPIAVQSSIGATPWPA